MRSNLKIYWLTSIILICFSLFTARAAIASDWQIVKASGDVWIQSEGAQKISLKTGANLQNGQELRTGNNGRVLLKRGEETILVTPNSVMALPEKQPEPGKTRILQQVGEILLEVEKKNVKHFEVTTPYLSAVVKGTKFRVTVDDAGAKVNVERGKVEVKDLATGQFVLVKPGQFAAINTGNKQGLGVGGKGVKDKIQQGSPSNPLVKPVKAKANGKINQAGKFQKDKTPPTGKKALKAPVKAKLRARARVKARPRLKIGRAIGPVRLNINRSTRGLSHAKGKNTVAGKATYWSKKKAAGLNGEVSKSIGNGVGKNNGNGNSNGNGNGNGIGIGVTGGLPPGLGGLPPGLAKKLGL